MTNKNTQPIYVASRASVPARPQMWQSLRAQGWPISSTWIDEAGEGETGSFSDLWQRIHDEITASCGVILYAEESDFPLKGAYIECGMALGMGKPVAVVLKFPLMDRSMRPLGSWANHPLVKLCQSLDQARDYVQSATTQPREQAAIDMDKLIRYDHQGCIMSPDASGDYFLVPDVRDLIAQKAVAIVTGSSVQWLEGAGKLADRAPLYATPVAAPEAPTRTKLRENHNDDGDIGWYFDCDGHYIDVERNKDGKYSVYFRNRADQYEAWLDQAGNASTGAAPEAPTAEHRAFWVLEKVADGRSAGYWDGGHSLSFTSDINKACQFYRKEDVFWSTRGWRGRDTQLTEHVMLSGSTRAAPLVPEVAASEQQTVAPPCPWCEKRALAPSHKDGTVQNYQCGECLNFSHAATTATCGNSHQSPYESAAAPSAGGVGNVIVDAATTASASLDQQIYTLMAIPDERLDDHLRSIGHDPVECEAAGRRALSGALDTIATASASGVPLPEGWAKAGERIVTHNFPGMITNCIAAATVEKRKEFIAALLAGIEYEIEAASRAPAPSRNAAPSGWQVKLVIRDGLEVRGESFFNCAALGDGTHYLSVAALTQQSAAQPCPTCGGSKVDPGGLPICRGCGGAAQAAHAGTARNMEIDAETIEQLKKGRWCEVSGEPRNAWAEAYDAKHGIDAAMSAATEQKEKP